MAKITIDRSSEFANKLRKIAIYINDNKTTDIGDGESITLDIAPGKHKLRAKIDWCYSNEILFDIKEGDVKRFKLNGSNPFLAIYYITFGRDKYLKLEQTD